MVYMTTQYPPIIQPEPHTWPTLFEIHAPLETQEAHSFLNPKESKHAETHGPETLASEYLATLNPFTSKALF